jgi:transcriptional regulator with XRE-family HTH domain
MPRQLQSVKAAPSATSAAPMRRTRTRKRPTVAQSGPHPIDLHVGSRVRLARLLAGRTQHWLAERVSLTFQQIQKYERGANRVSCSMLSEFAEALGRPVGWFFEDGPDESAAPTLTPETIDRQRLTLELVSCFTRVKSETAREHVVALARVLAEAQDGAA